MEDSTNPAHPPAMRCSSGFFFLGGDVALTCLGGKEAAAAAAAADVDVDVDVGGDDDDMML